MPRCRPLEFSCLSVLVSFCVPEKKVWKYLKLQKKEFNFPANFDWFCCHVLPHRDELLSLKDWKRSLLICPPWEKPWRDLTRSEKLRTKVRNVSRRTSRLASRSLKSVSWPYVYFMNYFFCSESEPLPCVSPLNTLLSLPKIWHWCNHTVFPTLWPLTSLINPVNCSATTGAMMAVSSVFHIRYIIR